MQEQYIEIMGRGNVMQYQQIVKKGKNLYFKDRKQLTREKIRMQGQKIVNFGKNLLGKGRKY